LSLQGGDFARQQSAQWRPVAAVAIIMEIKTGSKLDMMQMRRISLAQERMAI